MIRKAAVRVQDPPATPLQSWLASNWAGEHERHLASQKHRSCLKYEVHNMEMFRESQIPLEHPYDMLPWIVSMGQQLSYMFLYGYSQPGPNGLKLSLLSSPQKDKGKIVKTEVRHPNPYTPKLTATWWWPFLSMVYVSLQHAEPDLRIKTCSPLVAWKLDGFLELVHRCRGSSQAREMDGSVPGTWNLPRSQAFFSKPWA